MDNIWSFYESMPTLTRIYITACVLTTLGVQLDIISPFQLYFNYKLIFSHYQFWRLITNFLFFGTFSLTFMFNIIFTYRYCRMLEEGSFRSNSADFFFMLLFGAVLMSLIAPFVKLLFLSHAFTIMLVYIWAKRNTQIQLSLFGLLNFRAPHLPWILLGFSLLLGNSVLTDVLGIAVGHIYYYLEDVFPYLPGGFRVLKTPSILVYLFNPTEYTLNRLNQENLANQRPEERDQLLTDNLNVNQSGRDQTESTSGHTNENVNTNGNESRTDNSTSQTNQADHEPKNSNSITSDQSNQSNKEETLRNRSASSSIGNQDRYQEHDHLD